MMIVDVDAEVPEDDPEDSGKELTVTEAERDELRVQLARLKNSAPLAAAAADPAAELASAQAEITRLRASLKEAEAAACSSTAGGTAVGSGESDKLPGRPWEPVDDLWLDFDAEASLLPKVQDPIPKNIENALNTLAALYTAVPWGVQIPALTFRHLGVSPATVHTLLGDKMWTDCWRERHGRINEENFVPTKMVTILKWITEQAALHLENTALKQGQVQYTAVEKDASERRKGGSPY